MLIHQQDVETVVRELGSSAGGLDEAEAAARLQRFGPNVVSRLRRDPLVLQFLLVNGAFSFWQQRRAARAIEELEHFLPSRVTVLRAALCARHAAL